jgi:serine/threonine-protein kinase
MPVDEGGGGTRFGDGLLSPPSAPEHYQPPLSTGAVIDGKYRLERLLGEGGMGAVWRAHHLQLDLPVAIKLLRAGSEQSASLSERLKIEARAAAQLSHAAIVRVFDVDTAETGEPYIVMELLSGESLSNVLDRGRLSPVSAVQILLPIAEGLALAHGKGIVHRDLKPHNVFMVDDADRLQPKLLDFGIAKLTLALRGRERRYPVSRRQLQRLDARDRRERARATARRGRARPAPRRLDPLGLG